MDVTLPTRDGERLDAAHLRGPAGSDLCVVLAHSFAGSRRTRAYRRLAAELRRTASVVTFDFRGHGRSSGLSTGGEAEVHDLAAAVEFARAQGYAEVAAVGFSMGAACVIRLAAAGPGLLDAAVAVSAPARWQYRGTTRMRLVQGLTSTPPGRAVLRLTTGTRLSPRPWNPATESPLDAVPKAAATPLLLVHGARDPYYPLATAHALEEAAGAAAHLWAEPSMTHAEAGTSTALMRRIADWLTAPRP
ncbi:alpha/beta hydrolase [Streptomyces sp. R302]|nr:MULTISPECIES: alpha/beta fold hydrolase [unclassified Streptomyces]NML49269.1 alpha/beta hydrolase [Streptomyces sp. R301]NML77596.1 alpha/beta hydrolase [Streptomyces sp. R302]